MDQQDSQPAPRRQLSLRRALIWTFALGAITASVIAAAGALLNTELWRIAATLPIEVIAGLVAISLVAYVARVIRWRLLSDALGWKLSWGDAAVVYIGAFAFGATPGRVGELVRLEMMERRRGVPWADTTMMMFADRVSDLLSVAALAAAPLLTPLRALITVSVIGSGWLILRLNRTSAQFGRLLERLRPRWRDDLAELRTRLGVREGTSYRNLMALRLNLASLLLAAVAWIAEGLAFHGLLLALGFDVGVWVAVAIYSAATLAGALSMLPGGLGGFEVTATALLVAVGVPTAEALASVAVIRLVTFWFSVALGLAILPAAMRRRPASTG